jgi:hypothetical protein
MFVDIFCAEQSMFWGLICTTVGSVFLGHGVGFALGYTRENLKYWVVPRNVSIWAG